MIVGCLLEHTQKIEHSWGHFVTKFLVLLCSIEWPIQKGLFFQFLLSFLNYIFSINFWPFFFRKLDGFEGFCHFFEPIGIEVWKDFFSWTFLKISYNLVSLRLILLLSQRLKIMGHFKGVSKIGLAELFKVVSSVFNFLADDLLKCLLERHLLL